MSVHVWADFQASLRQKKIILSRQFYSVVRLDFRYKKRQNSQFHEGKGLVHLIKCHEVPEVEYRYCPTLSLTSALDGSGWPEPRPGRCTPGKDPVPIAQEAGWAQGRSGRMWKISSLLEFDPRTVQPVASRYTD